MSFYQFGALLRFFGVPVPPVCEDEYARFTFPQYVLREKLVAYGIPERELP